MRRVCLSMGVTLLLVVLCLAWPGGEPVRADGLITFENGVDRQTIQSTIAGLRFTTTDSQDWIYADRRTGEYNEEYFHHGNFCAWLGVNQGVGQIDFVNADGTPNTTATYLQVWASSARGLNMRAYDEDRQVIDSVHVDGNLNTNRMLRMRVDAPQGQHIAYVRIYDSGNFWIIDDLSTDAGGVPNEAVPVIVIPGIKGSRLNRHPSQIIGCPPSPWGEVWPAAALMALRDQDDHLDTLKLGPTGRNAEDPCDVITTGGIIHQIWIPTDPLKPIKFYGPLVDHLRDVPLDTYTFAYDWRLDLADAANELETRITQVLADTRKDQVAIVAHSMGGVLARHYVTSSPDRAVHVEQVITLGTPYLGSPEIIRQLRFGENQMNGENVILHATKIREIVQNMPGVYQLLPSRRYFDLYPGGYYAFGPTTYDTYESTKTFLATYQNRSGLPQLAEDFHTPAMDDWTSSGIDVLFRMIVGTGVNTPVVLREQIIVDESGAWVERTCSPIDGDGDYRVPTHSADLRNADVHIDYSGGASVWYAPGVKHEDLMKEPYIIDFVAALLLTPPTSSSDTLSTSADNLVELTPGDPANGALYIGPGHQPFSDARLAGLPPLPPEMSLEPAGLDGSQISTQGAVVLHAYDAAGNHTGPTGDGMVDIDIPGSTYDMIGSSSFLGLQAGTGYSLHMVSDGANEVDIKIKDLEGIEGDLTQRTILYHDAPIGAKGAALFDYRPNNGDAAPVLAVDEDGDDQNDLYVEASSVLDAEQSKDHTPPTVQIVVNGEKDAHGQYVGEVTVEIVASDAGSGVAHIEYMTSHMSRMRTYAVPFGLHAGYGEYILAQAFDRAGNSDATTTHVGPVIRLPLVNNGKSAWVEPRNAPPYMPSRPEPSHGATDQTSEVMLSWRGGDPEQESLTYQVYLEASDATPDTLVSDGQSGSSYDAQGLASNTTYYWQVVATDSYGASASGLVWMFSTGDTSQPFIWVAEAEDAVLMPPMVVGNDDTASSGQYISSPVQSYAAPGEGTAVFTVSIPASGNYYLWTLAKGVSFNGNSMFFAFDDAPLEIHEIHPLDDGTWTWRWTLIGGGPTQLTRGEHVLHFAGREVNTRLDAVVITENSAYQPTTSAH